MTGRLRKGLIAACVFLLLASCKSHEQVKTTGPPAAINTNAAEATSTPVPVTWSSNLDEWVKSKKELFRVWTKFERSQKYRLAQPGEVKSKPYLRWWGAEAYQGDNFLIAIVVDPSRSDPNRYGLVVVAAPDSEKRKYKAYWVTREENMETCEISPASGGVYFICVRADGTNEGRTLAWYRSRREFRLKPPYRGHDVN